MIDNFRKMLRFRYIKITIILGLLSMFFFGVSFIPYGWDSWTGILQGLSTGLISGLVLLVVTGTKSVEQKELYTKYQELEVIVGVISRLQENSNLANIISLKYADRDSNKYVKELYFLVDGFIKARNEFCKNQSIIEKWTEKQDIKTLELYISDETIENKITNVLNSLAALHFNKKKSATDIELWQKINRINYNKMELLSKTSVIVDNIHCAGQEALKILLKTKEIRDRCLEEYNRVNSSII